jgi:dTDP-4-amino-4,6-dideoxygalactose transaminase
MAGVTTVPLLDLKAQFGPMRDEIRAKVDEVMDNQAFILGPEVAAFEEETAAYCGAARAVGVSSGTDALIIALMALGVEPGDEVITSPFTFFATAGSITRVGAVPVFVDIEPDTYNIDPAKIEAAITGKTRAVMPVHIFGQCADMDSINEIASRRGLKVVEDAAQAIGSEYKGKRAGSLGDVGCFSFFPSKNLGGFGDGGMVTTSDSALADELALLRVHGAHSGYLHTTVGGNFRLDALQAAVLRIKLKYLDSWTEGRRRNADDYGRRFADAGVAGEEIGLPTAVQDRHIYNQFVVRAKDRDALKAHLAERKIGNAVYYPLPLHLQECFARLGGKDGDFPVSEAAAREVLALPVYSELTSDQRACVVEGVRSFYRG